MRIFGAVQELVSVAWASASTFRGICATSVASVSQKYLAKVLDHPPAGSGAKLAMTVNSSKKRHAGAISPRRAVPTPRLSIVDSFIRNYAKTPLVR